MSRKNDKALAAAREEIARVKASGETELDLSPRGPLGAAARDLMDLPGEIAELGGITLLDLSYTQVSDLAPIAQMTAMTGLSLSGTQVSDLAPIAQMTAMTNLDLSDTQVSDLAPIAGMKRLVEAPKASGLRFANTPATRDDPRLAEIAGIKDARERARALFDYLDEQDRERTERTLEEALHGPILSESLADVTQSEGRFRTVSLDPGPETPADLRHQELLDTLRFASVRFARVETQNRIGRDVAANFVDYAEAVR